MLCGVQVSIPCVHRSAPCMRSRQRALRRRRYVCLSLATCLCLSTHVLCSRKNTTCHTCIMHTHRHSMCIHMPTHALCTHACPCMHALCTCACAEYECIQTHAHAPVATHPVGVIDYMWLLVCLGCCLRLLYVSLFQIAIACYVRDVFCLKGRLYVAPHCTTSLYA